MSHYSPYHHSQASQNVLGLPNTPTMVVDVGAQQKLEDYLPVQPSHGPGASTGTWAISESVYAFSQPTVIPPVLPSRGPEGVDNYTNFFVTGNQQMQPQGTPQLPLEPLSSPPSMEPNTWEPTFDWQKMDAPLTFPTPSEMLMELAIKAENSHSELGIAAPQQRHRQRNATPSAGLSQPAEPGSISSHEKKRHYLECLEQYVVYLQQQMELIHAEPVPMERIANYRGLSSRSIRTLLVHMQGTTEKLNMRTLEEEQKFLELREAIHRRECALTGNPDQQIQSVSCYPVDNVHTL